MNTVFFDSLSVVGSCAGIGIVLISMIGLFRRPEPVQFREVWLKFLILIGIILVLLASSAFGKCGLLPIVLFIAYNGWQELRLAMEIKYGLFTTFLFFPALGILATITGLLNNDFTLFLGLIGACWMNLALPILITRRPPPMYLLAFITFGMMLISLPLAFLLSLAKTYNEFAFFILLVMLNDGFSEGFGRLLGKTKLVGEISPNKTWEGTFGGLISSLLVSYAMYAMRFVNPQWQLWQVLTLATGISITGLIGDLIFSSIKREAEIKNFGNALAVTGGVLDKFDSLLFAAPVFYGFIRLIGS